MNFSVKDYVDDVLVINKLKTKCGITGLVSFWFVREGSLDDINCQDCIMEENK